MNKLEKIDIEKLNNGPEYIGSFLGIQFTEVTENSVIATMPVTTRTHQPWGILHGGASVVLAESIGSYASASIIDLEKYVAVGLEVNANHIRPVRSGIIKGVGTPIHLGRKTHVWDVRIYNEEEKIVCISCLTVAIIPK